LIRLSSRRHWNAPSRRHPLEYCGALKPSRLGQIDAESVAFPLVAPRHFGAGVTEALLNVGFFDLGGTGKTGAQGYLAGLTYLMRHDFEQNQCVATVSDLSVLTLNMRLGSQY
jgi:hypothetical protein